MRNKIIKLLLPIAIYTTYWLYAINTSIYKLYTTTEKIGIFATYVIPFILIYTVGYIFIEKKKSGSNRK